MNVSQPQELGLLDASAALFSPRKLLFPFVILFFFAPAESQVLPIPAVPKPGPLSGIYSDSQLSLRYPNNWIVTQLSAGTAVIGPPESNLGMINGRGPYYSHAIFIGTYKPFATDSSFSFVAANEEYVAAMLQANPGGRLTGDPPLKFAISGHNAVMTHIVNPTSPIGEEHLFIICIDRDDYLSSVSFTLPARDQDAYASLFANVTGSIFPIPKGGTNVDRTASQHTPNESQPPLTPQEIARRGLASVVLIVSADRAGKRITLGTGFVVAPGVVATNSHVFQAQSAGLVRSVESSTNLPIKAVLGRDSVHDLALLAVPDLSLPVLPIARSDSTSIGDTIYAIGNPEGMEGTFSAGLISGERNFGDYNLIQITAPISHGSSGGPIMNTAGQVIGVSTLMLKQGQNLNFAVPVAPLVNLMSQSLSNNR